MAEDPLIGTKLGEYEVREVIGSGATGVVYAAEGPSGRVAMKVLNEALGHITSLRRRFQREARALAKVRHDNIVHIEDYGVEDDHVFIVMELLEGITLEEAIQHRPASPAMALHIGREILAGLASAHAEQVVHRDLKPANVFLVGESLDDWAQEERDEFPEVKILDFGLVKFLSVDELSHDGTLTRRGRVVGTPAYMAPEQITGAALDMRADVYAAGILFFELIADSRPFQYPRRSQLLRAHLLEPVPFLDESRDGLEVSKELESVIRKALEKDPAQRFKSAAAMRDAWAKLDDSAIVFSGDPTKRGGERDREGTNSVIISADERSALAEEVSGDSRPSRPGVREKKSDPPAVEKEPTAKKPAKPAPNKPERIGERAWITTVVWVLALGSFFALLGLAGYSTTLR